jgi:hypothetical protein
MKKHLKVDNEMKYNWRKNEMKKNVRRNKAEMVGS